MRFLHTSDWHLGRIFHGKSLIDDQAHVLARLLEIVRESELDALVVAGDIYDRAIPPVEAVELLDWFLSEVILGLHLPMIVISGNHDCAERLGFGSRLLLSQRLHVCGDFVRVPIPLTLEDESGPVHFYGVPYVDPAIVRTVLGASEVEDHETALHACLQRIRAKHPPGERSVLVAHAFVEGGSVSDSERPLSIGGAATVPLHLFDAFNYTALGHLHRPQKVGRECVNYSGSLLKYSFSEMQHAKSVAVVDLAGDGIARYERIPLTPKRDLRALRGRLPDLLQGALHDRLRDDYLLVILEDDGPVLDPLGKLRPFYPNILHVERLALRQGPQAQVAVKERQGQTEKDLYAAFFRDVTGENMSTVERSTFESLVETWHRGETAR